MARITREIEVNTYARATLKDDGGVTLSLVASIPYAPDSAVSHTIDVPESRLDKVGELLAEIMGEYSDELISGVEKNLYAVQRRP